MIAKNIAVFATVWTVATEVMVVMSQEEVVVWLALVVEVVMVWLVVISEEVVVVWLVVVVDVAVVWLVVVVEFSTATMNSAVAQ